jgi:hypothetical protein
MLKQRGQSSRRNCRLDQDRHSSHHGESGSHRPYLRCGIPRQGAQAHRPPGRQYAQGSARCRAEPPQLAAGTSADVFSTIQTKPGFIGGNRANGDSVLMRCGSASGLPLFAPVQSNRARIAPRFFRVALGQTPNPIPRASVWSAGTLPLAVHTLERVNRPRTQAERERVLRQLLDRVLVVGNPAAVLVILHRRVVDDLALATPSARSA